MSEVSNKEIELFKKYVHKVRLGKVFNYLGITPNDYQKELIKDYDNNFDKYHIFTSTLGRRSSKSFSAGLLAATHLQVPYASIALIAPNMKLTEIIWNECVNFLKKLGVKPQKINTQSKFILMENGATLQAGSVLSPENLIGKRYTLVLGDESAIDNTLEEVLELQVLPATTDFGLIENTDIPYAKLFLFSTPRGKDNIMYRNHIKGVLREKGYKSYQYPSTVNPLVTQEFLNQMRAKMDDLTFRQEYLAEYVDITHSTALYQFNYDNNTFNKNTILPYIKNLNIIAGIDIGFRDSSALVLIAKGNNKYYVFDALRANQLNTKEIYELFRDTEGKYDIIPTIRYMDKSAALTASDFNSYNYPTYPADNNRKQGIDILNQFFKQGILYIDKELKELIEDIISLRWNDKGNDFIRVKGHHHDLIHALRYAIQSDYKFQSSQDIILV